MKSDFCHYDNSVIIAIFFLLLIFFALRYFCPSG